MILQALFVVVDISAPKVQIPACAAADIGAGQLPAVEERLHHEGFAAGNAIDVDKGESVVDGNAEGHMMLGELGFQGSYAIRYRHGDFTVAQIFVGQGNAGDVDILNHALGKGLQQHFAAIVRGVLIVGVLAGHTAQLAASGHEDELGAAWEFLLHGMRHFRHGKVRGNESHDQGGSFCQVAEFLQLGSGQVMAVKI